MFEKEKIYIAGPECFYPQGFKIWHILREQAEVLGFTVTQPNGMEFDFTQEDRRKIADDIFANCVNAMNASTMIIADLEAFRGSEPDGGTVYELGMAFAKGARCYGYTRDKRPVKWKNQKAQLMKGVFRDEAGRKHPYADLPFCPSLIGSAKIIEGNFSDCLKMAAADREEEFKTGQPLPRISLKTSGTVEEGSPRIFLSGPERYDADVEAVYTRMKSICRQHGLTALTPLDPLEDGDTDTNPSPYRRASREFRRSATHLRSSDIILANLNDFRGWEPCNDTAFECGMAFQSGKKMYGYMSDTRRMIDRVPNYGPAGEYKDECGNQVENFDYPVNLMFASSMKIFEENFEAVISKVVRDLEMQGRGR